MTMFASHVQNPAPFGMISEERLAQFESEIHITLPSDYRQFLLEVNGGQPNPRRVAIEGRGTVMATDVMQLYGFSANTEKGSLSHQYLAFLGRIPEGYLPIGCDAEDNQFLIRIHPPHVGAIYFWYKQFEDSPPSMENVSFVSVNFTIFIQTMFDPTTV